MARDAGLDQRSRLVQCLTSASLIRFYSIVNMVVWGTVLVLSQGVLPVLHGCAGVIMSLEGIFAAASKNQESIRAFLVQMLVNLVFCVIMGPLAVENIYLECFSCPVSSENATNRIEVDDQVVCFGTDSLCERAFALYGWILIVFGAILQLPIFMFTVGFYFSVTRSLGTNAQNLKQSLEGDPHFEPEPYESSFPSVSSPDAAVIFKCEEVIPPCVSRHFVANPGKDVWATDTDVFYFNSDLSYC